MRNIAALSLITALLSPIAAFAAAPIDGPDALPAQVVGVIGSGNQLALQLRPVGEAAARTLHVGDSFGDGWVLSGVTASTATLTKAGSARTVGLNPNGAVAAPALAVGGASVTVADSVQARRAQADLLVSRAQGALEAAQAALDAARPGLDPQTLQRLTLALNQAKIELLNAQAEQVRTAQIAAGADPSAVAAQAAAAQAAAAARNAAMAANNAALSAQNAAIGAQRAGQ